MCPCNTSYAFFQEFSVRFAEAAAGTIFYLGFGESEKGAFPLDSFFAMHEIPSCFEQEYGWLGSHHGGACLTDWWWYVNVVFALFNLMKYCEHVFVFVQYIFLEIWLLPVMLIFILV